MTDYFPPVADYSQKSNSNVANNSLFSPASQTYIGDNGATYNIPVELAGAESPGAELPSPPFDVCSPFHSALHTPPAVSAFGAFELPWGTNLEPASPISLASAPFPYGPLPTLRTRPSLDQRMSGSTMLTFPLPSPEREVPLSPVGMSVSPSARVSANASAFQSPQVGYAAFYEDAQTPSVRDSGSRLGATSPEAGEETTLM